MPISSAVRPFISVFAARFLMTLQYRSAAFAGLVTQFWWGAIMTMWLAAFYAGGRGNPSVTLADVISYIWLGQAFLGLLPWNVDPEIAAMMRSGHIAYERLRPVDTYLFWLARAAAWRAAATLLRAVPLIATAALLLPMIGLGDWALRPPPTILALVAFLLSGMAMLALSAAVTTLLNISVVWTISGQGIVALTTSLVLVLSGQIVPLALFPDWAQTALLVQPLAGLADIPRRIYCGNLTGAWVPIAIGLQIFWSLLFVWVGRAFMERTMRRIQVLGG